MSQRTWKTWILGAGLALGGAAATSAQYGPLGPGSTVGSVFGLDWLHPFSRRLEPRRGPAIAPAPVRSHPTYTVRSGDSLWKIAKRHCGDGRRWKELHAANRDTVPNPNLIRVGQVLEIDCEGTPPPPPTRLPPAPTPEVCSDEPSRTDFAPILPLPEGSYRRGSGYGPRTPPVLKDGSLGSDFHKGIDYPAPVGTPISAVERGKVIRSGWSDSYGWVVYLKHDNGLVTRYAHMRSEPRIRVGQRVEAGEVLGGVGSSGACSGAHLHFEVRDGEVPVSPDAFCWTANLG